MMFQQKIIIQITIIGESNCSGWLVRTETLAPPLPETSDSIAPRLGLGGWTPNPKKDNIKETRKNRRKGNVDQRGKFLNLIR